MWSLGPIGFASPWILAALVALPAIWWLVRATPPVPRRVAFPAFDLLAKLKSPEQEPARTPLWLILLRLALAALLILALSGPTLIPRAERAAAGGPLLLVVDNDWASASDWRQRRDVMRALVDDAARAGAPVVTLSTAARLDESPVGLADASEARAAIDAEAPTPWLTDRARAAKRLTDSALKFPGPRPPRVVWLTNGLDAPGTEALLTALRAFGPPDIIGPSPDTAPLLLGPATVVPEGLSLPVLRAEAGPPRTGAVNALSSNGRVLGTAPFSFGSNDTGAKAVLALPRATLNDAARIEIAGMRGAGTVQLLDEASRKRHVGLVSGDTQSETQPLLSDLHYLRRALEPFSDVTSGGLEDLLRQNQSMIVLADVGRLSNATHGALVKWIEAGGTLVRFAGPRMAEHPDDLVPVPLRQGGRTLGGALSWAEPQGLAPFEPQSPFAGLEPSPDVKVSRQVLAEPSPDLAQNTWARLTDGTPLVTSAKRGAGLIVLFHVSASTAWSNLPLSGLYVDMLKRLLALSHMPRGGADAAVTQASGAAVPLAPIATLDGFGALGAPPLTAVALPGGSWRSESVSPRHPPGLYGPGVQPIAFNIGRADAHLAPLRAGGAVRSIESAIEARARPLGPALLAAVFVLGLADMLAMLVLSGVAATTLARLSPHTAKRVAGAVAFLLVCQITPPTLAAERDDMRAALEFHLAYVKTGSPSVDAISQAGLVGLGRTLAARTAVEPAEPMGVDLATSELAFFPLIYWQISADQPELSETAAAHLGSYLKHGGTLVIDTADADQEQTGDAFGGPNAIHLRRVLARLDLPPLEPLPSDHVLTKSFYLLKTFPGRYANGRVWVERVENGSDHDGVATIIFGSNDWASAWARDDEGRPLAPLEPGGEDQREWAMRFGVNLVMYALTGNYKADQVHVPALLERLGQ